MPSDSIPGGGGDATHFKLLACVASVPVRAKCYVSGASEDSGRVKIGGGGGG